MKELLMSAIIALTITIALGPLFIPLLHRLKFGQEIRQDGPQTHQLKAGTPTMGGIIIVIGLLAGCLFLLNGRAYYAIVAIITTLAYGLVGFLDDFIKVKLKRNLGLKAYQKLIAQFGIALAIAVYAYINVGSEVYVPIVGTMLDLGVFYIPFIMIVVIGTVNGVNLTDGLDGLASGVTMIVTLTFGIFLYNLSQSLTDIDLITSTEYGNLANISFAVTGACLGFLAFNFKPAKVFMGDTGSLALGGVVSVLFILTKMPLLLPVMGGMFLVSCLSDIIQVTSYKLRKKRVFKMAPLHHHFELSGMPETSIVIMYYILTALLCVAGLLIV